MLHRKGRLQSTKKLWYEIVKVISLNRQKIKPIKQKTQSSNNGQEGLETRSFLWAKLSMGKGEKHKMHCTENKRVKESSKAKVSLCLLV